MPKDLLQLNQVSKIYTGAQSTKALDSVSLTITKGEFAVIVGPSGCGKTTLLRIISGLESLTSGEARFSGELITKPDRKRAYVFQEPRLFPWLTVQANLKLAGNQDKARDLMELMDLLPFAHAYPSELSGGMAKKAALARALALDPELLLLDEPLVNLDFPSRRNLQKELHRLWTLTDLTCLLVTHDIDEALALATRLVIFSPRPGKVVKDLPINLPFPRHEQEEGYKLTKEELIHWILKEGHYV